MEMFDPKIDNDLKLVDTKIREYYGLTANAKQTKQKKGANENEGTEKNVASNP